MTENTGYTYLDNDDMRIAIYRWFSTLFSRQIEPETLDEYRYGAGAVFLKQLVTIPVFAPEVKEIQDILKSDYSTADLALDLAGDYGYLFLGSGCQQSVPPYESVYTSEKGAMFQEAELQTARTLNEYGLGISKDVHEPADHIAIQLELLARLDEIASSAASANAKNANELRLKVKTFMDDHLLSWVPCFCLNCIKNDPGGFYAALAKLLLGVLQKNNADLFV